ncbi:MAG: hypothetical protein RSC93_11035 [Erysipelotrichaceae bacterium]
MKKIMLAVGLKKLEDEIISKYHTTYQFRGIATRVGTLFSVACQENPDYIIVRESLPADLDDNLIDVLLKLRLQLPETKIIYLTVLSPDNQADIARLISFGIYDIWTDNKIRIKDIIGMIENSNTFSDAAKLIPEESLSDAAKDVNKVLSENIKENSKPTSSKNESSGTIKVKLNTLNSMEPQNNKPQTPVIVKGTSFNISKPKKIERQESVPSSNLVFDISVEESPLSSQQPSEKPSIKEPQKKEVSPIISEKTPIKTEKEEKKGLLELEESSYQKAKKDITSRKIILPKKEEMVDKIPVKKIKELYQEEKKNNPKLPQKKETKNESAVIIPPSTNKSIRTLLFIKPETHQDAHNALNYAIAFSHRYPQVVYMESSAIVECEALYTYELDKQEYHNGYCNKTLFKGQPDNLTCYKIDNRDLFSTIKKIKRMHKNALFVIQITPEDEVEKIAYLADKICIFMTQSFNRMRYLKEELGHMYKLSTIIIEQFQKNSLLTPEKIKQITKCENVMKLKDNSMMNYQAILDKEALYLTNESIFSNIEELI